MLLTLHRYILREMLKTFALCALALTLLVTMGGGAANLLRGEGFSAADAIRIFLLFVPVAVTFALPVAAMFSAAMTYGRMSADNEITACRAAGINIHRLFASAVAVGAAVSGLTYYSWNYFIPHYIQAGEQIAGTDLARLASVHLQKNLALTFGRMVLHADRALPIEVEADQPLRQRLRLEGVAFLELDGTEIVSYGTARVATVMFDRTGDHPQVSADLWDVRTYNARRGQYAATEYQPLAPYTIPLSSRERVSFLDLPTLRSYARDPTQVKEVAGALTGLRRALLHMYAYEHVVAALDGGRGACELSSRDARIELRAEVSRRSRKFGDIGLRNVRVRQSGNGVTRVYSAASGTVVMKEHPDRPGGSVIQIELVDADQTDEGAGGPAAEVVRRARVALPTMDVPASVRDRTARVSDADILNPETALPENDSIRQAREWVTDKYYQKAAQVVGLIHFRSTLALSCAAMILLAALLGVIFRGSHVLTAFGTSCLPALAVALVILAGRQLSERGEYNTIGLSVMWGMDALLAAATALVAFRWLGR
ncbi:MAG: LptF/LptG family permease [Phycisphaerae bacterium]|nr:LptF/LptG family permease [Phycisphaerae bacterium]NUQ46156.1 LptF/LptG family permease [Phycisphaerae bacterium]